jgi:hypothetical protein
MKVVALLVFPPKWVIASFFLEMLPSCGKIAAIGGNQISHHSHRNFVRATDGFSALRLAMDRCPSLASIHETQDQMWRCGVEG